VRADPNATATRVTTITIESTGMVSSSGPAATFTRENTKKTNEMAMEKCTGRTVAATMVSGSEEFSMATAK